MNTNVEVSKEVVAVPVIDTRGNYEGRHPTEGSEVLFVQTDAEVGGEVIAEPVASVTVH